MTEANAPNRLRVAELLRKLRGITVEAGASEAEAMTAAAKARQLADEHGLPLDEDPIVEIRLSVGRTRSRPIDQLWPAVGRFCHASVVFLFNHGERLEILYAGRSADILLAEWLHTMLKRHVDKALATFKTMPEYRRRKPHRRRVAAAAFVEAMAQSLRARLDAMSDRAIARQKLIEARTWIADRYGALTKMEVPAVRDRRTDSARIAGARAGADVPINTPVAAPPAIAGLIGGARA